MKVLNSVIISESLFSPFTFFKPVYSSVSNKIFVITSDNRLADKSHITADNHGGGWGGEGEEREERERERERDN